MIESSGFSALPGIQSVLGTVENHFWWDRFENQIWLPAVIDGASRDSGNTVTDVLRPGLLLGRVTSTNKCKQFDPTATDGTAKVFGILGYAHKMTSMGSNADRYIGWVMVSGCVKADKLLIPGQSSFGISGNAYEHLIRRSMHPRFLFSDRLQGNDSGGWHQIVAKTADYTVTGADSNTLFTNRGASGTVNFTLPATPAQGLRFGFHVVANQTVTLTSGTADTLIVLNDATADTVSLATTSLKIGGHLEVIGDGTGWLVVPHQWIAGTSIPAALTDSTGGTANGTLVAISGSGADADINNNFADLAAKLNAVLALLQPATLTT